jgi:hypothetical protein
VEEVRAGCGKCRRGRSGGGGRGNGSGEGREGGAWQGVRGGLYETVQGGRKGHGWWVRVSDLLPK